MKRRDFLKNSAMAVGAGIVVSPLFAQEGPPPPKFISNSGDPAASHLTCYPDTENGKHQLYQLWIRKNNTVLTSYRAHRTQKYPFFYPVAGPISGLSLTAETSMPWPHHRSLFFGMDRVNGGNYWQDNLTRGQIISQGPSFAKDAAGKYKIDDVSVEIIDQCLWRQGDADPIIEDSRKFLVKVLDEKRYMIDANIVIKALTKVTAQKSNHGLFGVRCAPDLAPTGGGVLVNADGIEGEKQTLGKPSRWMAFYGRRAGPTENIVEGIAVFCPSKSPHPLFDNCPWFTRDYGNCSPMPMNWFPNGKSLELAEGEELKLRYRVVAFAGTPKDADLDGLWTEFDKAG